MSTLTKIRVDTSELKDAIKQLTNQFFIAMDQQGDSFADTDESVTSYVARMDDEVLNRTFYNFSSVARSYVRSRNRQAP